MDDGFLERLGVRAAAVAAGQTEQVDDHVPADARELRWLLDALWRYSVDSIVVSDIRTWSFVEVSDSFCDLTGYSRAQILGRTPHAVGLEGHNVVRMTRHEPAGEAPSWEGLYQGDLRRQDGSMRRVEFSRKSMGEHFMATIVRDITRRHELELELRRLADTDPLTGLMNRRKFTDEVAREIRESGRFGDSVSLIVLDLDGLKSINDSHGHHTGDLALQAVADTLRRTIRDVDFAGRLGGDEFAVLLTRSDHQGSARFLTTLHAELGAVSLNLTGDATLSISASAGSATTKTPDSVDALFHAADQAMYRAKRNSRQI